MWFHCYFQESDIAAHVTEILEKWEACQVKAEEAPKANVDAQLSKLMESQSLATTTRREYTDEEKKIREAILSQYSQLSDNEVTIFWLGACLRTCLIF